jgi:hypothetical protein
MREKQKAAAAVENKIRLDLAKRAIKDVSSVPPDAWRIIALLALGNRGGAHGLFPGKRSAAIKNLAIGSVDFAKAIASIVIETSGLEVWRYSDPKTDRGVFIEALELYGVKDASASWLQRAAPKVVKAGEKEVAENRQSKKKGASAKKRPASKPAKKSAAAKKATKR